MLETHMYHQGKHGTKDQVVTLLERLPPELRSTNSLPAKEVRHPKYSQHSNSNNQVPVITTKTWTPALPIPPLLYKVTVDHQGLLGFKQLTPTRIFRKEPAARPSLTGPVSLPYPNEG